MSYDDDDVERLLRGLPAPAVPAQTRERHLETLRAAMAADGVGEPVTVPVPLRPRRRRVLVAIAAAVAVVLFATAAATIIWRHASNRSEVRCFPGYVTDFDNPQYGDTMMIGADTASNALDICTMLWRDDYLESTPPYAANGENAPQPVPPLIACVLPNDEVGVFPADEPSRTCDGLGLPRSSG